ncbi:MAG: hypothetical protein ABIO78_02520, partial [Thermoanaerobaculia bacterium]
DVVLHVHVFMVMPLKGTQMQIQLRQVVVEQKLIGKVAKGMNPVAQVFVLYQPHRRDKKQRETVAGHHDDIAAKQAIGGPQGNSGSQQRKVAP